MKEDWHGRKKRGKKNWNELKERRLQTRTNERKEYWHERKKRSKENGRMTRMNDRIVLYI